jgi:hypothetical protein
MENSWVVVENCQDERAGVSHKASTQQLQDATQLGEEGLQYLLWLGRMVWWKSGGHDEVLELAYSFLVV